ncbi:kinase-like domain-containing protein [Rhizophagus clarus]|nr:kinase-like domain-containing protein [Rhizophagus clarus]
MCSDCYYISSGWIKSTLFEKLIPILYLPWWDTSNKSSVCSHNLKFITDNQKWCPYCFIIYSGCRYCLTTNIIFGITDQTQCKKCERVSTIDIDITNISSGNHNIDEFLVSTRTNIDNHNKIANYMNNTNKNFDPLNVYNFIDHELKNISSKRIMEWIPYSRIKNLEKIAEGGFGIIYKATWFKTDVAVKRFLQSRDISNFLNEVKSLHRCYDTIFIVKYYGITQDPEIKDYMLIMEYAGGGDLHNYLRKNFIDIKWTTKLTILCQISDGLKTIHNENFIHRDFHSGNILSLKNDHKKWVIGDLGLSQPANNSSNNEIYGVIPYVAPEIFKGGAFSKESDIYSLGMIMWELTSGRKPFFNVEHDINLIYQIIDEKRPKRPIITNDTPECYSNLIKRCLDSDPSKRPSITEIKEAADDWYKKCRKSAIFRKAEETRTELIRSKQLGPEFVEKQHPSAIYTSRPLNSFISQPSSVNSSSPISKQDYTSKPLNSFISQASSVNSSSTISKRVYVSEEYEFDIQSSKIETEDSNYLKSSKSSTNSQYISTELDFDIETNTQRLTTLDEMNMSSADQNSLNTQHSNAVYTSRPLSVLISNVKNNSELNIKS